MSRVLKHVYVLLLVLFFSADIKGEDLPDICDCPVGEIIDPECDEPCAFGDCCIVGTTEVSVAGDQLFILILAGIGIGLVTFWENKKIEEEAEDIH